MVWRAVDKKSRETVALKKIFDAFQNATDAQVLLLRTRPARRLVMTCQDGLNTSLIALQRTFREIMFLQELTTHENIIRSAAARTLYGWILLHCSTAILTCLPGLIIIASSALWTVTGCGPGQRGSWRG